MRSRVPALALGCASTDGHFDFDPAGAEAGEIPLPTGDVAKSQLVERRVRAALERELVARGLTVHQPDACSRTRRPTELVRHGCSDRSAGGELRFEDRTDAGRQLASRDAVHVAPGPRAIVEGWGGEQPLEGVVRRVEPFGVTKISALGIEEQRVNVLIDLAEPRERWRQLGHGFRVEPSIVLWESDDALRVPFSALFRDGEDWALFVASAGRAELRRVKIGRQNGLEAEAISGLAPGERVVIHPSDRVEDGARLRERS